MTWWEWIIFFCPLVWVVSVAWELLKKVYTLLHQIEGELRDAVDHLKNIEDYLKRIDKNTPYPGFWIEIQDLKGRPKPEAESADEAESPN